MGEVTEKQVTEHSSEKDGVNQCAPCRGTGKVIRGNIDPPELLPCPWCEGSGKVIPEHNAQEHWKT